MNCVKFSVKQKRMLIENCVNIKEKKYLTVLFPLFTRLEIIFGQFHFFVACAWGARDVFASDDWVYRGGTDPIHLLKFWNSSLEGLLGDVGWLRPRNSKISLLRPVEKVLQRLLQSFTAQRSLKQFRLCGGFDVFVKKSSNFWGFFDYIPIYEVAWQPKLQLRLCKVIPNPSKKKTLCAADFQVITSLTEPLIFVHSANIFNVALNGLPYFSCGSAVSLLPVLQKPDFRSENY